MIVVFPSSGDVKNIRGVLTGHCDDWPMVKSNHPIVSKVSSLNLDFAGGSLPFGSKPLPFGFEPLPFGLEPLPR